MRRIAVLGPPGSGKSTLARALGARLGLPVFHLDQAFWRPGWVAVEAAALRAEVERISALPAWVVDGNYLNAIGPRLAAADTLVYLDVPSWLSTLRVLRRSLAHLGQVRADMAPGCPERLSLSFLRFTWRWNRTSRARSLACAARFAGRTIVLRSPDAFPFPDGDPAGTSRP